MSCQGLLFAWQRQFCTVAALASGSVPSAYHQACLLDAGCPHVGAFRCDASIALVHLQNSEEMEKMDKGEVLNMLKFGADR